MGSLANSRRRIRRILAAGGLVLGLAVGQGSGATPAQTPPRDYGEGLDWHEHAAEAGGIEAQYRLGLFHEMGIKTEADLVLARYWFQRAAEQGHAFAQFKLATYQQTGTGGPVDLPGAVRWYRAAAEQGLSQAQYNLATLLERGQGTEADPAAAAALYEAAAKAGISEAASQLAVQLIDGRGVAEDRVAALAWLILASDDRVPGAAALRDQLTAELGPTGWSEALRQASAIRAQ